LAIFNKMTQTLHGTMAANSAIIKNQKQVLKGRKNWGNATPRDPMKSFS